jgi:arylsulfatase A
MVSGERARAMPAAVIVLAMWLSPVFGQQDVQDAPLQPNFVLILADDQGWTGLSTPMDPQRADSASDYYQTPRLDRLAREGMRFSQAYSPAATCSPTRHSIQFGMSPAKLNFVTFREGQLTVTAADALVNRIKGGHPEYAFAHYGKWHIRFPPEALGYDDSDGPTQNDEGNRNIPKDDPKLIFSLTRRANAFMRSQVAAGRPFFIQISHYADHDKAMALERTIRKYEGVPRGRRHDSPLFAAMNENLDTGVGMVLDELEALRIAERTYVIYMADNGFQEECGNDPLGGRRFGKAAPLLASKCYLNEGGVRVPLIVRGPGIAPGSHSKVPVIAYDILPTIMDILGMGSAIPEAVEGGSWLAVLRSQGQGNVSRRQSYFVFRYSVGPRDFAIDTGRYKLLRAAGSPALFLYDLDTDIGEQENLAAVLPDKARELNDLLQRYMVAHGVP